MTSKNVRNDRNSWLPGQAPKIPLQGLPSAKLIVIILLLKGDPSDGFGDALFNLLFQNPAHSLEEEWKVVDPGNSYGLAEDTPPGVAKHMPPIIMQLISGAIPI